jgi:tetratricopeptide (TPR) repeat protein
MHKRTIYYIFILLFVLSNKAIAQSSKKPQQLFSQANEQLQKGDIRQALTLYHRLEDRRQFSGGLFLNMGLSYVRLDSMGKAKYYFLKAQQFDATQARAQKGLDYVENQFSHQSAVLPELPWQQAIHWISVHIGAALLLGIGLILFNIGLFGYIIPWYFRHSSAVLSSITATIATIGVLVILLSFYINYRGNRYHKAVMVARKAPVTKKPAADAAMVNKAYEGYLFTVDQRKSNHHTGWSYIRMSNGQYGWIASKEIKIL